MQLNILSTNFVFKLEYCVLDFARERYSRFEFIVENDECDVLNISFRLFINVNVDDGTGGRAIIDGPAIVFDLFAGICSRES